MISVEEGIWSAPANCSIAKELLAHKWRLHGQWICTDDLKNVIPFLDHLDPGLLDAIVERGAAVADSRATSASDGFDPPISANAPGPLIGFQKHSIERIINQTDTLLADDAGTGKTAVMIAAANILEPACMLVICPAIAKYNWMRHEWPKWATLDRTIGVVEGDAWCDTDVVIINYDLLGRHKARLQERLWNYMCVDESRRLKNDEAIRTVMVLGGTLRYRGRKNAPEWMAPGVKHIANSFNYSIPHIRAERRVFADATPMDRPRDLWTLSRACDPTGLGNDWEKYHTRYCNAYRDIYGWHTGGADNLDELGARLRSTFMVRHKAEEVLGLPPIIEDIFLLKPLPSLLDAERQFVQDHLDALLALSESMGKGLGVDASPEQFMRLLGEGLFDGVHLIGEPQFEAMFTEFAKLRHDTGMAKIPGIVEYIAMRNRDGEEPLVVFGYHREVLQAVQKQFPESALILGGVPGRKRQDMVDAFQNGETNLIIGQIDAMGESVTLTRSRYAAIAETDWRGTALYQARKRVHRLGQQQRVIIEHLCAPDSFDYIVANTSLPKLKNMAATLD